MQGKKTLTLQYDVLISCTTRETLGQHPMTLERRINDCIRFGNIQKLTSSKFCSVITSTYRLLLLTINR